eukprot:TRINITY_DN9163_c0_g1_i1.p1 TRINITY_DN9163_c0_g1~~TRINITY_DN9163_c0_g1_i1.p1  ORF type:complete len:786 (+),score=119.54 TRINITY_DN9163_c0_g1_i1:63-2420(+)
MLRSLVGSEMCIRDSYYRDLVEEASKAIKSIEDDKVFEEVEHPEAVPDSEYKADDIKSIPLKYESVENYKEIWEPLFYLETKAQILRSRQSEGESDETFFLRSANKIEKPFIILVVEKSEDKNIRYSAQDLVVVSLQKPDTPQDTHFLGFVDSVDFSLVRIKTVLDMEKGNEDKRVRLLAKDSVWFVQKICNLSTLNREFQAIQSVEDFVLKNLILNPSSFDPSDIQHFEIPATLEKTLKSLYNESQFDAMKRSLKKEGITLIQGPPGTGKTTTILGVLSVLLNSHESVTQLELREADRSAARQQKIEQQKAFKSNILKAQPWLWNPHYCDGWDEGIIEEPTVTEDFYKKMYIINKYEIPPRRPQIAVTKPQKILICAPSNAAIDEIVRKINSNGIFDNEGNPIKPFLVRLGPNLHESLREYSLDYLIDQDIRARNLKEADYEKVRNDVLNRASILCSTLSVAGSGTMLSYGQTFDTIVVDEAAQAVEISSLIPLKYGCRRLIMIGDPSQLPATIFSNICKTKGYALSMFQRMQKCGYPIHMLDTQYRMHPMICEFISREFYDNRLQNAPGMVERLGDVDVYNISFIKPLTFLHVDGFEDFVETSYQNSDESATILGLYEFLKDLIADFDPKRLGVISPYSRQVGLIRRQVCEAEAVVTCPIEVNTVDGFQGREKDIIVFSTVRSKLREPELGKKETIGFLDDIRRMNVSLSRAKQLVIVVGNAHKLQISKRWHKLVRYSQYLGSAYKVQPEEGETIPNFFRRLAKNPSAFALTKSQTKKATNNI